MAKPIELTEDNFKQLVLESDKPVLVDFWATWCGPCRAIAPIIEEMADHYDGKAVIGKLDVDANSGISMEYGVMSIPTLLVFKGGKVVEKQVGLASRAKLEEKLNGHLVA